MKGAEGEYNCNFSAPDCEKAKVKKYKFFCCLRAESYYEDARSRVLSATYNRSAKLPTRVTCLTGADSVRA